MRRSISGNSAAASQRIRVRFPARAVTANVVMRENGSMPLTSPASTVLIQPSEGPFSRRTCSSPSAIITMRSAGVPSTTDASPGSSHRSVTCSPGQLLLPQVGEDGEPSEILAQLLDAGHW